MYAFLDIDSKAHLKLLTLPFVLTLCFALVSCSGIPIPGFSSSLQCQSNCSVGSGVQGVQVFVEPDDGEQVITNAIANAQKSIWLEIYYSIGPQCNSRAGRSSKSGPGCASYA